MKSNLEIVSSETEQQITKAVGEAQSFIQKHTQHDDKENTILHLEQVEKASKDRIVLIGSDLSLESPLQKQSDDIIVALNDIGDKVIDIIIGWYDSFLVSIPVSSVLKK